MKRMSLYLSVFLFTVVFQARQAMAAETALGGPLSRGVWVALV